MLVQKGQLHSGLSKYRWRGPLPLVQKVKPHTVGMQYALGTQCAVCVGAKRSTDTDSTHTVDLANMGGGDHYL